MPLVDADLEDEVMIESSSPTVVCEKQPSSQLHVLVNDITDTNDMTSPKVTPNAQQILTPGSQETASTSNTIDSVDSLLQAPSSESQSVATVMIHNTTSPSSVMTETFPDTPSSTVITRNGINNNSNQIPTQNTTTTTTTTTDPFPMPNGGQALYAVRLPGIGKFLAVKSGYACDVDALYEQRKVACDVDAYVDDNTEDDDDDDDDDDSNNYPTYTSSTTEATGNSSRDDDIETANHHHQQHNGCRTPEIQSLDPHTDPFALRVGKKLSWRNINMTLQPRNGKPAKKLLHNVWGEVPSTETTAIMGASGAGKTSLLNILAGRARSRGRIRIEADVRLENYIVDPTNIKVRKTIAFVAQDDSLQSTATPREAIRFSAKLRLPRTTTDSQLDSLTNRMLQELGLNACADTVVGGPLLKGISGGERKRASVGVELVVKPAMVFLDEPTSGLDSFSAVQVCKVLKKVANSGASVLFTIHQPSSEIFDSFDRLILLHKGRVLFQGSVKSVPSSFASCGFPLPNNFNPADWVINVAQQNSIPNLEAAGFFADDTRDVLAPSVPRKGQNALGDTIRKSRRDDKDDMPPGLWTQIKILFKREFTYMYRFPQPQYARFGFTAFLSFLIGIIFFKVGDASPADLFNITSQFGALMILLMLAMLGTAQPALLFFPEERPIFLREYSTDHYSVMSYFVSRLIVEMMNTGIQVLIMVTMIYFMVSFRGSVWMYFGTTYALAMSGTAIAVTLGVLAEGNAKVAQQLLPLVFIPQLLFSGFFVSPSLIPQFLRWMQYLCVLTYAVRVLVLEEFLNCSTNATENRNCQRMVDNVRADPDKTTFYWSMLVVYFVVFRSLALLLLRKSATKFY